MLVQERSRPMYLLSPDPQTKLWHYRLGNMSNVRVAQTSKLVDKINLREIQGSIDEFYSFDSKFDSNSDENVDTSTPIHKAT